MARQPSPRWSSGCVAPYRASTRQGSSEPPRMRSETVRFRAPCQGFRKSLSMRSSTKEQGWIVYMLRCGDRSLYTGITNDLSRRLTRHRAGTASAYTRARRPVRLVYEERQPDRSAALRREAALRRLSRAEKLALVRARG